MEEEKQETKESSFLEEPSYKEASRRRTKETSKKEETKSEKKQEKTDEEIIAERKKKVVAFFKKTNLWVLAFLVIALILGIYIRSLPMSNHTGNTIPSITSFIFHGDGFYSGKPGLWDITTNDWTLGPDLDPWLFTRYAKTIVEQGSLPTIDTMRNSPLGFDTTVELQMVSYLIVLTHKVVNLFGQHSVNFSAVLMPVLAFALTILTFFLFVREIFIRKNSGDKNFKANVIALVSTFFMIVIPTFLSRTVAGIPEKESVAFFFMFLSFYLFLKAWKSEKIIIAGIFGILAGISTALMGLSWGGVSYIYVTVAVASLVAFILNKVHKKEAIIYGAWFFFSILITQIFSNRVILKAQLTSLDTGLAFLVFFIPAVHFILWKTKVSQKLQKLNIPKNILSLIFALILGIILVSIFLGPSFIIEKVKALNQMMFKPVTGRWSVTVAENRQPYFTEWGGSFGPFIQNIPILFWMFFIGSVVLFKQMLEKIKKKDAWILTALYILFFFGLVFSRYAPHPNTFDGENFISKFFYYGSALLLIGALVYFYMKYSKTKDKGFEEIDFEYLFLFSLFILCLFTARSAVRLIMVLGPIAPIFVGCLIISSFYRFRKTEDETIKVVLGIALIIILLLSLFVFWNYYKSVKAQAYSFIPSYYNQQWQKAMEWVRENTPKDAVFGHWWDYGYWLQSIGERATVTDGGNAIVWWNYLSGRLVLTGDNEKDALDFLYSHNTTHLLIDSTDIGKYTAFSSIGSDLNYDRYSWIPIMTSDEKQIQETRNGTTRIYQGASGVDEDIFYKENGQDIFLPGQRAAIISVVLESVKDGNKTSLKQPEGVFYYQGIQHKIPLRYVYFNGQFFDFKKGLNATAYVFQRVYQTDQGLKLDNLGALMYLSPRLMRGMLAQKYLLDDPFNNFPNFELVHSEPNLIVDSLNSQGMNLNEFVLYQEVQGPIKIWEINYTGKEKIKKEYLDTDYSKYINWSL